MGCFSAFLFMLSAVSLIHASITVGSIDIPGEGTVYVAGNNVQVSGNSITINYQGGVRILSSYSGSWDPNNFHQFHLIGKTLSFTADLLRAGCGCNGAVYLVSMPGPRPGGWGDYYCDANQVNGAFCPEIDIMEANNNAFQTTPHKCNPKSGDQYDWCDKGGCGINSYRSNPGDYGWGSSHKIDGGKPFRVATTYGSDSIKTVLSQDGNSVTYTHTNSRCGGDYVSRSLDPLNNGMVLVMSYWGDSSSGTDMKWLDEPPCDNRGCGGGSVTFSDFRVDDAYRFLE